MAYLKQVLKICYIKNLVLKRCEAIVTTDSVISIQYYMKTVNKANIESTWKQLRVR